MLVNHEPKSPTLVRATRLFFFGGSFSFVSAGVADVDSELASEASAGATFAVGDERLIGTFAGIGIGGTAGVDGKPA